MVNKIKIKKAAAFLWMAILFLANGGSGSAWATEALPDNRDYQACWRYTWRALSDGLYGYDDSFRILARKLCNASPAYGLSVPQKRELRECLVDRSTAFPRQLDLTEVLWRCLTSMDISNEKASATYHKIMKEQDPEGDFGGPRYRKRVSLQQLEILPQGVAEGILNAATISALSSPSRNEADARAADSVQSGKTGMGATEAPVSSHLFAPGSASAI